MSDVKRYVTTCDCMSPAAWGDYVRYDDYAALEAELAKLRAGQEPVAWIAGCYRDAIEGRTDRIPLGVECSLVNLNWFDQIPLYTAPQPSAVPDGWKLVPVEPTEEMLHSDHVSCPCGHSFSPDLFDHVYHRMLAAAPSAPATAQGGVYSTDPLACSGCVSGCFRCRSVKVQGDGWIPVSERLPDVEKRFDKPCELEGKSLPPLNITSTVQCFDGTRVFADAIEWFDGGQPMKGVTHWKPLDAAPAAIAAARQEGGKV